MYPEEVGERMKTIKKDMAEEKRGDNCTMREGERQRDRDRRKKMDGRDIQIMDPGFSPAWREWEGGMGEVGGTMTRLRQNEAKMGDETDFVAAHYPRNERHRRYASEPEREGSYSL